jgi:alpha-glucosidase
MRPFDPSDVWWRQAVLYQIYPRSFQDSNSDGIGDLEGVRERLDYLVELGVDGLWMSPIYPSPLADGGYDISDYTGIHPELGTLEIFESLVADAHARGLRVILDLVPNHTSLEHPWFRQHPDWYVWSDRDGPANNWLSAFGGPAWSRDEQSRAWYLHSFYREQPDLNWRLPEVREAVSDVIGVWVDRGVDGFRVDAVDRLSKDAELRDDPPAHEPWLLPLPAEYATLHHIHSRNAPGIGDVLSTLRAAAGGTFLVGEVFRPTGELALYLEHFDAVFAFEFMFCPWRPPDLARVVAPVSELGRVAWVLGNHDFSRLATRLGEENTRLAAMLLLTLPGPVFIYQGDELGMVDGPPGDRWDRAGRDMARHPMQWEPTKSGGFTRGTAWLPAIDPEQRNVRDQLADPTSVLSLYRNLLRLRRQLSGAFELEEADQTWLAFRRGSHRIRLNFSDDPRPMPDDGSIVIQTHPVDDQNLAPHSGVILKTGVDCT